MRDNLMKHLISIKTSLKKNANITKRIVGKVYDATEEIENNYTAIEQQIKSSKVELNKQIEELKSIVAQQVRLLSKFADIQEKTEREKLVMLKSLIRYREDLKKDMGREGNVKLQEDLSAYINQINEILWDCGVEFEEVKRGDDFNPQIMKALKKQDASSKLKNKVIEVYTSVYTYGAKVINKAEVVVGGNSLAEEKEEQ